MRLERIRQALTTFGLAHEVMRSGVDGALLMLPECGRVLGLWTGPRAESALRINPGFLSKMAIGAKDDVWTEPGGERVWLAPPEEYFAGGEEVPASIDPGRFAGRQDRLAYAMENRGEAYAWSTGAAVRFRVVRRILPVDDAWLEQRWGPTWLRRAGYVEECTLSCDRRSPPGTRLASFAQLAADARLAKPGEGPAGAERVLCVVPGEQGHAQLVVKAREPLAGADSAARDAEFSVAQRAGCVEMVCLSPALAGRSRLSWTTSLSVFSGRTEEVENLAQRIAG